MKRLTLLLLTLTFPVAADVSAQDIPQQDARWGERMLSASRIAGSVITLDGRLEEQAWVLADSTSDFAQVRPRLTGPPSQRTTVRVLFDDRYLYVGVRAYDESPEEITAPLARKDDEALTSDWVHVMLDPRHDRRTAFGFSVNPRGVQRDIYFFDNNQQDVSWDAVWEVATQIDTAGWTAEFRVPLSQLRFSSGGEEGNSWGLQVMRDIARHGERVSWAPWTGPRDPAFVSQFGILNGLEGIRSHRRIELIPFVAPRLAHESKSAAAGIESRTSPAVEAGLDLRLGLPSSLTLSATANPDFSQVEADPAEVNLTTLETLFTERRPFFTEGTDAFRFGEPQALSSYALERYLYSRRIGRAPQRSLMGSESIAVEAPLQTRILGAAKVSGRTPGGWSIGLMDAVTAEETATLTFPGDSTRSEVVEPLTNYFAARVRRDMQRGATTLGALITATNRNLGSQLDPLLHGSAHVAGADFSHAWADRAWSVAGHMAVSRVQGDMAAIDRTQRSPLHFFQRPDADHLHYQQDQTSLDGHLAELSVRYVADWMSSLQLKQVSPGFHINDLGFQTRADSRSAVTFLGRRVNSPHGPLRDQFYYLSTFHAWTFGAEKILDGGAAAGEWTFLNLWRAGVRADYRPQLMSDKFTRGGPLAALPSQREFNVWVESDPRRMLRSRVSQRYWSDASGARSREAEIRLTLQPTPAIRLGFSPRLTKQEQTAQYVSTALSGNSPRYLFARLDHTTAAAGVRLDWTFTPELTLQGFAEPFVSAGDYSGFQEFLSPRKYDFAVYGQDRGSICHYDGRYYVEPLENVSCPSSAPAAGSEEFPVRFANPDFNVRSLRTSAVLRWEYRPGSMFFVVWQQDRNGRISDPNFDLGRATGEIFRDPGRNVLLLKLSYWLGI